MVRPRNSLTFKMPPQLATPNSASGNQYWKSSPAKVMRASGTATPEQIKKVKKQVKDAPKPMSAEMAAWVKANRKKLTSGKQGNIATEKQKALFRQYDALKKAGNLPSTANVKRRPSPSPQAQPSTSTKSGGTKPVQKQTRVQKGVSEVKASNEQSKKTVVQGKPLPSNPLLKSQPKKSKLNPQQRRKAGQIKKRRGMSPADAAKSISDKLRLTYKKGQIVKRGGKFYKSDGKGGFTLVHSKQF